MKALKKDTLDFFTKAIKKIGFSNDKECIGFKKDIQLIVSEMSEQTFFSYKQIISILFMEEKDKVLENFASSFEIINIIFTKREEMVWGDFAHAPKTVPRGFVDSVFKTVPYDFQMILVLMYRHKKLSDQWSGNLFNSFRMTFKTLVYIKSDLAFKHCSECFESLSNDFSVTIKKEHVLNEWCLLLVHRFPEMIKFLSKLNFD